MQWSVVLKCPCVRYLVSLYRKIINFDFSFLSDGSITFICVSCLRIFPTKNELVAHEESVTELYDCEICDDADIFEGKKECTCPRERDRKCFYCKEIVLPEYPKSHRCFHKPKKQFICLVCWCDFDTPTALRHHIQHLFKYYICISCNTFFEGEEHDHSCETRDIKCAFCKKYVKDVSNHKCFHLKTMQDFRNLKVRCEGVQCDMCNERVSQKLLPQHRKEHYYLKCDLCGRKFFNSTTLRTHRSRVHKVIECEICGKVFDSNSDYLKHKREEHLARVCYRCGKQLSTAGLKSHMKRCQNENPQYKCEHCGKCFAIPEYLKRHMLVHTNEYKHECSTCHKKFKNRFNMRVHMRIHDDKKPFECSICHKTFTTKQWRDSHMKTHKAV
ncbi:hypothetical protein JTB14_006869 [Gonioctena quinquepunctata]|nr:hypothetical protein JTB14_006869 [Gonioctena quinquepunctata]